MEAGEHLGNYYSNVGEKLHQVAMNGGSGKCSDAVRANRIQMDCMFVCEIGKVRDIYRGFDLSS